MKRILVLILLLSVRLQAQAGDFEAILSEIKANNLSLKALQAELNAQGHEINAELTLSDPEIEYALLVGPGGVLRHDIGISQNFDYATISGIKKQYALSENALLSLQYKAALRDVLQNSRQLICEIIYRNALIELFEQRLEHAREIQISYKEAVDEGELAGLEYRRMLLETVELEGEYDIIRIERNSLLSELTSLNGGIAVELDNTRQAQVELALSFEDWLADAASRSTALGYLQAQIVQQESKLKLQQANAVPSLSVGYMAELTPDSPFRGVRIGLNIPIWSAGKRIAAARAGLEAAQAQQRASVLEWQIKARALYDKAAALQSTLQRFQLLASSTQALDKLDRAYHSGQLSLLEYYSQSANFFLSLRTYLDAERQYASAMGDLKSLEL